MTSSIAIVKAKPKVLLTAPVGRASEDLAEKDAYTAAYLALKSGRLVEASKAFNAQLDRYPKGRYVDQAWYWLGETRLAQHDFNMAFNAFKFVVDHYSGSVKHAAALLRMGEILERQKRKKRALRYYRKLLRDHPDSSLVEGATRHINMIESVKN